MGRLPDMEAVAPHQRLAGRYVLEAPIAAGGMATVWKARDPVLARDVAVKILRQDLSGEDGVAERFHREAVAAAALSHPHIIGVFDTGTEEDLHFIVMELFPSRSLWQILSDEGPLPPHRAVAILAPVLDALAFAHRHGLIHRDIKPGNILVGEAEWVKVTDFGIAKAAYQPRDLTATGALLGTVRYISPEQVQGRDVDGRSDLYSAGVVLYEALTGRVPFQAETDVATAMLRVTQDPEPPRQLRPDIPKGLEEATLRAMARDPQDRFGSAEAMLAALERFQDAPTTRSAFAGPGSTRMLRPQRRREASPAPATRRRGTFRVWFLVPLILLVLAAGAIATGLLEIGGPVGIRPGHKATTGSSGGDSRIDITTVRDFDPQGLPNSEHPDEVGLAIDGDTDTVWSTDHYNTADFGRLKDGVGLWLGFGHEARVTRVVIRSPFSGWSFQLRGGTSPDSAGRALTSTDGASTFTADSSGRTVIEVPPTTTSGMLVWITQLAPDEGRFAAAIAEVSVQGSTL
jgi:eukaryotic-like serine/threonine-protein kinase